MNIQFSNWLGIWSAAISRQERLDWLSWCVCGTLRVSNRSKQERLTQGIAFMNAINWAIVIWRFGACLRVTVAASELLFDFYFKLIFIWLFFFSCPTVQLNRSHMLLIKQKHFFKLYPFEMADENEKLLLELLRKSENSICADCKRKCKYQQQTNLYFSKIKI